MEQNKREQKWQLTIELQEIEEKIIKLKTKLQEIIGKIPEVVLGLIDEYFAIDDNPYMAGHGVQAHADVVPGVRHYRDVRVTEGLHLIFTCTKNHQKHYEMMTVKPKFVNLNIVSKEFVPVNGSLYQILIASDIVS